MPPLDLSGAQQAVTALASHIGPVTAYVQAVTGLPLSPQTIFVSGQPVGTFSPLAHTPALSGALAAAQQSCQDFQLNVVSEFPVFSWLASCSGEIQQSLAQIEGVLLSQPASGAAVATTSAQAALQELVDILLPLNFSLSGMASGTSTFLQQLSGDNEALTQGTTAIGSSIPQIEQWVTSAVIQDFALSGIFCQIGAQMISGLRAVSTGLSGALAAAPVLPLALTNLETVFAITSDYYADVSAQLASASASGVVQILQALDVQNAEALWQDLITYIDQAGIGSASAP
jgi:hypothetical protein